jgi:hypothetical protein
LVLRALQSGLGALFIAGGQFGFDPDQGALGFAASKFFMHWAPITTAPFDRDLELAVLDEDGAHALEFACRRIAGAWINAQTKSQIDVRPTHWREWKAKP